mmetsp:Transcript_80537/g.249884  ORF Transcript_80537/g.249884 Transcript_80537/m.249884 type:complete len:382 (+) Transcript_80537:86-1231(+)
MPHIAKGAASERQQAYHGQFRKTVICRFYLADACKKGSKCTFAHSVDELQEVPDLKKTALCKMWKRGNCALSADRCPFAHTKRELRVSPAFADLSASKRTGAGARSPPNSVSTRCPESADGSQSSRSPQVSPRDVEYVQSPLAPVGDKPSPIFVDFGADAPQPAKAQQTAAGWQPEAAPPALAELPRQTMKEHEPAFVELPGVAPCRDRSAVLEEPRSLRSMPPPWPQGAGHGLTPTGARVAASPGAGQGQAEGRSTLALSDWLLPRADAPRVMAPGPSRMDPVGNAKSTAAGDPAAGDLTASPTQSQPDSIRQRAAELRAYASAAEQKAAAFALEAARLRSFAETAEREVTLVTLGFDGTPHARPRPVDLASLLEGGGRA